MGDSVDSESASERDRSMRDKKDQYNYPAAIFSVPPGPLGLSRDTWAKLVIWFLPIIFASGALFFSFQNMDTRVNENSDSLKKVQMNQSETKVTQRVQAIKLDSIQEVQAELKEEVQKVDTKLDGQKDDLTAIKAKLGVRSRNRR